MILDFEESWPILIFVLGGRGGRGGRGERVKGGREAPARRSAETGTERKIL